MKISVLCENTNISPYYFYEHGLSLYLESKNKKILFDFGQTDLCFENARLMNIDLSEVDIAILSHGHYDHSGGLKKFLEINSNAKIFINKNALGEYYNVEKKYIGLEKTLWENLLNNPQVIFVDNYFEIEKDIELYSCNEENFEIETYGLCEKKEDGFIPEKFIHEQYLLLKEDDKKILISGCSHKGIINLIKYFKPDYLIGGFHLMKLDLCEDEKKLKNIAEELLKYKSKYYTCHCTGLSQYDFIKNIMKNKIEYICAGKEFFI